MKTVFERVAASHPDRTILNCSEAGLTLAGIPNMPLREALALPQCEALGGQRRSWTLRARIRQRFAEYKPQVKDTLLEAVRQLRSDVEHLSTVGHRVPAFIREHGLHTAALRQWVLAQERVIQAHPVAWGLFAIRSFDIVEIVSTPPPDPALVPDDAAKERYNCERLVRVARVIAAESANVRRLVRQTLSRLEDLLLTGCVVAPQALHRQLARQEYRLVWRLLHSTQVDWELDTLLCPNETEPALPLSPSAPRRYAELCSRVLTQTQQYEAALALMQAWDLSPGRAARLQRHLQTFLTQGRDVLPAYFLPQPAPAPLQPQAGFQIGA
jgi:hypothetical protein